MDEQRELNSVSAMTVVLTAGQRAQVRQVTGIDVTAVKLLPDLSLERFVEAHSMVHIKPCRIAALDRGSE